MNTVTSCPPAPRRKRLSLVGLAAILTVAFSLLGVQPAHAAAGDPYSTTAPMAFIHGAANVGSIGSWYQGSTSNPSSVALPQVSTGETVVYNAMGFNPYDGFLYAVERGTHLVIKIGQDGTIVDRDVLGAALPAADYAAGDIDPATGLMYVKSENNGVMQVINLVTKTVTQLTLSTAPPLVDDWTFSNGLLWGASRTGNVSTINPTTGAVTVVATGVIPNGQLYGAAYTLPSGNVVFVGNQNGRMYSFNTSTQAVTVIGTVTPHTWTDGASVLALPVDLAITKTGPAAYQSGKQVTYTVEVSNESNSVNSTGGYFTDTLPAGTTFVSSDGGCTNASGTLTCPFSRLDAGESRTVTITVSVDSATTGTLTNAVKVFGNETDPNPDNDEDTWSMNRSAISLTKSVSASTFKAGDKLTYTFVVTNAGQTTLTNIAVTESAFSGTGTVSAVDCGGATQLTAGQKITCTATYTATAADVTAGKLTNTASVSAKDPADATLTATDDAVTNAAKSTPTPTSASPTATESDSDTPLADTGTGAGGFAAFGLALLALGAVLVPLRRRQH